MNRLHGLRAAGALRALRRADRQRPTRFGRAPVRRATKPLPCYGAPGAKPDGAALAGLVYELLDAHHDTTVLAAGLVLDAAWGAHLDYLRRLQRIGREALARQVADACL